MPPKLAKHVAFDSGCIAPKRLSQKLKPGIAGRTEPQLLARVRVKASKNSKPIEIDRLPDAVKTDGTTLALKVTETGSAILRNSRCVRRGRRSTALRLPEVENIFAAAVFTAEIQLPLNRFTTIHFEAASLIDPVRTTGRYTKLAGDWLRTKGAVLSYLWVRESAGERKGDHVHLLWSIPPDLIREFARREIGWRKKLGGRAKSGAFKSKPVGRSYRHAFVQIQFGEQYKDHLRGIVGYLVKGAEPKAVRALGLVTVESGGELWGKRSGMSANIDRAARRRAELRTSDEWVGHVLLD